MNFSNNTDANKSPTEAEKTQEQKDKTSTQPSPGHSDAPTSK